MRDDTRFTAQLDLHQLKFAADIRHGYIHPRQLLVGMRSSYLTNSKSPIRTLHAHVMYDDHIMYICMCMVEVWIKMKRVCSYKPHSVGR